MTSPRRAVLTAVLATLALAGCSSSDSGTPSAAPAATASASSPSSSPSADAPSSAPATGDSAYPVYVALGDSYTAAPLVPTTDTGNGCLRSDHNYPALVAAAMPGTALTDVSCSGADSSSMIGVQQTGNQPQAAQFDALNKDTDLVTIGIGGNDFNLFATLVGVCSQLRAGDPTGNPCETKLSSGAGGDQLAKALPQISGHVKAIVAGIKDRAPNAKVYVVGYPQIIPSSGTCSLLPLADGDYPYARTINEGLASAVERGAADADGYVDMFAASKGHDICSDDPWVNGAKTDPSAALAFHPFAAEQQAAAALLLKQLR